MRVKPSVRTSGLPACLHPVFLWLMTRPVVLLLSLCDEKDYFIWPCCCCCCCSVKQGVQSMEICRRPALTVYDNLNQNSSTMMTNFVPSTSGNITVTFNNQLNALHSQVRHSQVSIPWHISSFHILYIMVSFEDLLKSKTADVTSCKETRPILCRKHLLRSLTFVSLGISWREMLVICPEHLMLYSLSYQLRQWRDPVTKLQTSPTWGMCSQVPICPISLHRWPSH